MTEHMRAAYVERLGPPEAIRVGPLPVPVAGGNEVLVAVRAVAVNPVDAYVRSGRYATAVPLPFVIGRDLVGTVVEAPAATGFAAGEQVWCDSMGHAGRQGVASAYAAVPADRLYRLPAGVDPYAAVAVAQPAATAYLGWFVHAGLRAGETVFVGGGGGNVGSAAIAMAARAGARVLATAGEADHARCRAAGASAVRDYHAPDLAGWLAAHTPNGVDVIWETSGHHDFTLVASVAAPGARVLVTATAGDPPVPLFPLYTKDVSVRGFVISRARADDLAAAATLTNHMLAAGALRPRIAERLPLSEAARAHRLIEAGGVRGRLVLEI